MKRAHIHKVRQPLVVLSLALALPFSCATKEKSRFSKSDITWDELVSEKTYDQGLGAIRLDENLARSDRTTIISNLKSKSKIQSETEADFDFSKWARYLKIERPSEYEGGVYGKVGSATVFLTSNSVVPDFDRLHWVMVKVLSEKYGCFIVGKVSTADTVKVSCKDRRTVVFRRSIGSSWIMFYGRQYDDKGREVVIASRDH